MKNSYEIEEIKKPVQFYIDAVVNFDLSLVNKAWHEDGIKMIVNKKEDKILFQKAL